MSVEQQGAHEGGGAPGRVGRSPLPRGLLLLALT